MKVRNSPSSVLLVGATGFVGAHLLPVLSSDHEVLAVRASSPPTADPVEWVTWNGDHGSLVDIIHRRRPDCIINAAALSSAADCEREPDLALTLNGSLPGDLARAAAAAGRRFLQLSTDQVFDGTRAPYAEDAPPAPLSTYGRSKAAGEALALSAGGLVAVLRLNLVVGSARGSRPSATDRLIAKARRGEDIPLFTDEFRSPIRVQDIATAIAELVDNTFTGLLHLGGPERLSRHQIGRLLLDREGLADLARPVSRLAHIGPPRSPDTTFDSALARSILHQPPRSISEPS